MNIGINARFLTEPGTGIGQVTLMVTEALERLVAPTRPLPTLYVDERLSAAPSHSSWAAQRTVFVGNPYPRRDRLAHLLWERWWLPAAARRDGCTAFFSLYQSASHFPMTVRHAMLVHDLVPEHFPEYQRTPMQRLAWRAVRRAIGQATELICPSEFTADDCVSRLAIPRERISVIPLGVSPAFCGALDPAASSAVLRRFELQPQGYILHAGGLELRKNTARLLQAYAALSSRGGVLPPLVIAGKLHAASNPLATPVAKLIAELGLQSAVRVLGFVPAADLPALIAGACCFVYPSLFEGFGLPVLEAMAVGTAVLTSRVTALPEVAGEAAAYCDPLSVASIAEALGRLMRDDAARRQLGERGLARARQFSWKGAGESMVRQAFQMNSAIAG